MPIEIPNGDTITIADGRLYLNGEEIKIPNKLIPPDTFEQSEMTYITELFPSYADKEKVPAITADTLHKNIKNISMNKGNHI